MRSKQTLQFARRDSRFAIIDPFGRKGMARIETHHHLPLPVQQSDHDEIIFRLPDGRLFSFSKNFFVKKNPCVSLPRINPTHARTHTSQPLSIHLQGLTKKATALRKSKIVNLCSLARWLATLEGMKEGRKTKRRAAFRPRRAWKRSDQGLNSLLSFVG
jgi:hypothetical protein